MQHWLLERVHQQLHAAQQPGLYNVSQSTQQRARYTALVKTSHCGQLKLTYPLQGHSQITVCRSTVTFFPGPTTVTLLAHVCSPESSHHNPRAAPTRQRWPRRNRRLLRQVVAVVAEVAGVCAIAPSPSTGSPRSPPCAPATLSELHIFRIAEKRSILN